MSGGCVTGRCGRPREGCTDSGNIRASVATGPGVVPGCKFKIASLHVAPYRVHVVSHGRVWTRSRKLQFSRPCARFHPPSCQPRPARKPRLAARRATRSTHPLPPAAVATPRSPEPGRTGTVAPASLHRGHCHPSAALLPGGAPVPPGRAAPGRPTKGGRSTRAVPAGRAARADAGSRRLLRAARQGHASPYRVEEHAKPVAGGGLSARRTRGRRPRRPAPGARPVPHPALAGEAPRPAVHLVAAGPGRPHRGRVGRTGRRRSLGPCFPVRPGCCSRLPPGSTWVWPTRCWIGCA